MVVELIAKDKSEKLQYEGTCKLMIDSISKVLLVEPIIEEFKIISALFKWQFVAQKNILFVFAEHDFQDFALVFEDTQKCVRIHKLLIKLEAVLGDTELIKARFLSTFFTQITETNESTLKMKEILLKWIKRFDKHEKREYNKLLESYNICDLNYTKKKGEKRKRCMKDVVEQYQNIRNGKATEDPPRKKLKLLKNDVSNKIIVKPNFQLLHYMKKGKQKETLIVFCLSNKNLCYEFYKNHGDYRFVCLGCEKINHVSAKVCSNSKGETYVKLNKDQHVCDLREFDPSKYRSDIVIPKAMYEILEKNLPNKPIRYLIILLLMKRKCATNLLIPLSITVFIAPDVIPTNIMLEHIFVKIKMAKNLFHFKIKNISVNHMNIVQKNLNIKLLTLLTIK